MKRPLKQIIYSSHFERAISGLSREIADMVLEREKIFRADCFDPRLKTHKLKGRQASQWSFSLTKKYRIVFRFLDDTTVYFIDVGDHSIYQ